MNSRPGAAGPWSERAVDGACLVFAAWTVACHASVAVGGSLWMAASAFALLVGGGTLGWRHLPDAAAPAEAAPEDDRSHRLMRAAGILAAAAVAVWLRDQPLLLWWAALGILGAATFALALRDPVGGPPAARGRTREAVLWAAALACAGLALLVHRPDLDDAFYLNLAVAAVDEPGAPLLLADTLHGVSGLPIHHPIYRVHTWELWNALVSWVTGLPVIASFHFVSAALGALLVPLAWARLFRRLVPETWLAPVLALIFVLLVVGELHRGYANFGFVRMWQGKSVFVSVLLPVVAACAIDFARAPSLRRGVLLAAVQVAALGCSSSALWAAPAVAVSAALSALRPDARSLRTLGLVVLASAYVLGVALVMRASLLDDFEARRAGPDTEARREMLAESLNARAARHAPGVQLDDALEKVVGRDSLRTAGLFALLAAWALVPPGAARRYASVVPWVVLGVLLNPYATDEISRAAVGNSYWRAFWVLPLPALTALCLTCGFTMLRSRAAAAVVTLLACAAFARLPAFTTLDPANEVRIGAPAYKVPQGPYRAAEIFHAQLSPGAVVVAPRSVSAWLPTFPGRSHPLLVRDPYLRRYRKELGNEDLYHRLLMTDFASGVLTQPDAARHFTRGLERYAVRGVLLAITPDTARAREALREAGFAKVLATLEYEIWVRG